MRRKAECFMIGLCDDEPYIHEIIEKLLIEYAILYQMHYKMIHFYSGYELLQSDADLDVLFLDIDMPDMDGIEVGKKLRAREKTYKIVMLTAKEERYREAFKIGAFRFIPKPIEKQEFFDAILDVCEHLIGYHQVEVYRDGIAYAIPQKNIVYIMADRSATLIFTRDSEFRSEYSLVTWRAILDERLFFASHKSYLVNLSKIEEIEKNKILLVTGEKILVSKRRRLALLHAFMEYDTKHR